jgi:hypothetical protein
MCSRKFPKVSGITVVFITMYKIKPLSKDEARLRHRSARRSRLALGTVLGHSDVSADESKLSASGASRRAHR